MAPDDAMIPSALRRLEPPLGHFSPHKFIKVAIDSIPPLLSRLPSYLNYLILVDFSKKVWFPSHLSALLATGMN